MDERVRQLHIGMLHLVKIGARLGQVMAKCEQTGQPFPAELRATAAQAHTWGRSLGLQVQTLQVELDRQQRRR